MKQQTGKEKTRKVKRGLHAVLLRGLVYLATGGTVGTVLFLIGYILWQGVPFLSGSLFSWVYTTENVSLMPALWNTLFMILLSMAFAVPVGIGSAVYLVEYAKRGSRFVECIRLTTETLAGIPSIVYGLFGALFFVKALDWGLSLLSGSCTLAVMILPLIMRTTEEALKAVPDSYREGSFGLGAGRVRTIFEIILPAAIPGITSGILLSIGRVVGESAALIFTAGTMAAIPDSLFGSARTLSVHMYCLYSEGLYMNQAAATAVVLLGVILFLNALSYFVMKKMTEGEK